MIDNLCASDLSTLPQHGLYSEEICMSISPEREEHITSSYLPGCMAGTTSVNYYFKFIDFSPGDAAGQFTAAPPTCPGDTFTFTCTVGGSMMNITIWRVGRSSECTLVHRSTSSSICGPSDTFTARSGTGFGTSATSFTSTLSGTATSELDGTVVECFGPANNVNLGNRVDSSTIQILGQFTIWKIQLHKILLL